MTKTTYSFRDFTMVQPLRQALDYLQDHDECRAGLDALKYLVDTVGLDLGELWSVGRRCHTSLGAAGVTKRLWEMSDIVNVLEAWEASNQ
jgi:hypothetical protein